MSELPTTTKRDAWGWLPEWARPLEHERRGLGSLRLAETTILILLGIFLAVATVNDVVQQTHVNHRLKADLLTWRTVTGHDYVNLATEQDVKTYSTRDIGLRKRVARRAGRARSGVPDARGSGRLGDAQRERRLLPAAVQSGPARQPLQVLRPCG